MIYHYVKANFGCIVLIPVLIVGLFLTNELRRMAMANMLEQLPPIGPGKETCGHPHGSISPLLIFQFIVPPNRTSYLSVH